MAQWLSIFLIKDGIDSAQEIFRSVTDLNEVGIDQARIDGRLFVKERPVKDPSWIGQLQDYATEVLPTVGENSLQLVGAAVLLINRQSRIFALPFGYGWSLINPDVIEQSFGLDVVLNSVKRDDLKALDAKSFEGVTISHRREASMVTDVRGFGVDTESHLLTSATGAPRNFPILGTFVSGKDPLRLSTNRKLDELSDLLDETLRLAADTSYQEEHEWVTRLSQVRKHSELDPLNRLLAGKFLNGDFERTWMALPEPIERLDFHGFKFSESSRPLKRDETFDDLSWEAYHRFRTTKGEINADRLFTDLVHVVSDDEDAPTRRWKVHKCIYCEIEHENSTYFLDEGRWYRIDTDFLAKLNRFLEPLYSPTTNLPECSGLIEKEYNQFACKEDQENRALLDLKLLKAFVSEDALECCDILENGTRMIHIKHYSSSAKLSHLFNQGAVGGSLFKASSEFRHGLNKILPERHKLADPDAPPLDGQYEIVYAIIRSGQNKSHNLPLFSKLMLRDVAKRLISQGFKVSVEIVTGTPRPKKNSNDGNATTQ